jgi:hypothetical protein
MDGRVEGNSSEWGVVVMMVQASLLGGGKGERTKGQGPKQAGTQLLTEVEREVQFHKLLR